MWTIIGSILIATIFGLKVAQVMIREFAPESWAPTINQLYHWTKCAAIGYGFGSFMGLVNDTVLSASDWHVIGIALAWVYHELMWDFKLLRQQLQPWTGESDDN